MNDHSALKGTLYLLFSAAVWAGWIVASRYGVKGTLTAYDITAIRFGVAGVILLPFAVKNGLAAGPYGIKGGLLLAFCIGAPYTNLAIAGMQYAPASHASTVINGTLLLLTTLVGIYGLKEKTSVLRLAGVACSLTGIICMLMAKGDGSSPQQWLGHVFFMVCGVMWGTSILLVRAWRTPPLQGATAVCVLSLLFYLPFYLLCIQSHISWHNWREVLFQALYQGALNSVIAFIAFNRGVHLLGASRAGAMTPLVPVLATLLAIPVLGEVPLPLEWAGVAAVSCGVLLGSGLLSRRTRPQPPAEAASPNLEN